VGQHFELQPGDARQVDGGDQAIVVLVGIRTRGLHRAVRFLRELRALGGFQGRGRENVPGGEAAADLGVARGEPRDERRRRLLLRLRFAGRAFGDDFFGIRNRPRGEGRLIGEVGFGGGAGLAVLVDAVEESGQAVVVGVGDRIELVRMTLRAAQRQTEPGRADGVHAIDDVIHARLLGIAAAFAVGHVIAVETGR
jgi:hypothetical protein